jgi:hypothetical protein
MSSEDRSTTPADIVVPPRPGPLKRLANILENKLLVAIFSALFLILAAVGVFQFANWAPLLANKLAYVFAAGVDNQSTNKKITETLVQYLRPDVMAELLQKTLMDETAKKGVTDTLVQYLQEPGLRSIVDMDVKTDTKNYLGAAVKIHHVFEKEGERFTFPVYVPADHSLDILLSYEEDDDSAVVSCGDMFAFYFTVQWGSVVATLPEDKANAHPWFVRFKMPGAGDAPGTPSAEARPGEKVAAPFALQVRRGHGASYSLKQVIDSVRTQVNREQQDVDRVSDQALKDIYLVNAHAVMMNGCKQVPVAIIAMVGAPLPWPNTTAAKN